MKKIISIICCWLLCGSWLGAEMFRQDQPIEKSGVLQYFPPEVKSVEAWHGQVFKVEDLPLLPQTPEQKAQLEQLVGQKITVRGTWFVGTPWESDPRLPQPSGESRRGYGLLLMEIVP
jgi:hypothetical protein